MPILLTPPAFRLFQIMRELYARDHQLPARNELARMLKLARLTVSKMLDELLAAGVLARSSYGHLKFLRVAGVSCVK